MPLSWVQSTTSFRLSRLHLKHHDLCLKFGAKTMVAWLSNVRRFGLQGLHAEQGTASELIDIRELHGARLACPTAHPVADLGPDRQTTARRERQRGSRTTNGHRRILLCFRRLRCDEDGRTDRRHIRQLVVFW